MYMETPKIETKEKKKPGRKFCLLSNPDYKPKEPKPKYYYYDRRQKAEYCSYCNGSYDKYHFQKHLMSIKHYVNCERHKLIEELNKQK
jgi:hypothetical protein